MGAAIMRCSAKGWPSTLDNAFYSVAESLIGSFKENTDIEGLKLAAIMHFGIDTGISAEQLDKEDNNQLAEKPTSKPWPAITRRKLPGRTNHAHHQQHPVKIRATISKT